MYDSFRADVILHELNSVGRVAVNDLAERLGVSAVTIRKDLDSLEQRSLLRRVRGGAVAMPSGDEGAFNERLRQGARIKRAIGRQAAELVRDGDAVAIDSSTTCYYLAQELLNRNDLLVVTDGLRLATLLMEHSNATILMPGGVIRRQSGSMVGALSDVLEGRGRISKGFFGVATVSLQLGMLGRSDEEAKTKRSLISACDAVYGLFTSSKIGGFGLHPFADPDDITGFFTDENAPDEFVASWSGRGVPVTRVEGTGAMLENGLRAIEDASRRAPIERAV